VHCSTSCILTVVLSLRWQIQSFHE